MSRKVELLAPAGNPEGFYGAIHAGADAVYLGGNRFGARAYADNFTTEELIACIRYAHIWGRRVYLTVNTLVKEKEFPDIFPYLQPLYEAGLDGVIVQDIGVFHRIKECFPDMELHASTQMTLTSSYGASLLKYMGAVRIVPARELSLDEIREIKERTGLEVETFIHGAMCYCYSGQCLFSSVLGGRSGNRGRCAQPCRLPYLVDSCKNIFGEYYPLSLKDMCTIEHIPELIQAGIDSFKIEGRMKKPEYAAGVTAIYRKYIDKYYAGEDYKVSSEDLSDLAELYIRSERQNGYYFKHNGRDMVTLSSPSYNGGSQEQSAKIRDAFLDNRPQMAVNVRAEFIPERPARLTWSLASEEYPNLQAEVTGDIVTPAIKQPITEENIRKQLNKLGDTSFVINSLEIRMTQNCFYPLKAINELRRRAVESLEDQIILMHQLPLKRENSCFPAPLERKSSMDAGSVSFRSDRSFRISVRTGKQLEAVLRMENISCIYLDADLIREIYQPESASLRQQLADYISFNKNCSLFAALPQIIRKRDELFLRDIYGIVSRENCFKGFLVRSMDGLGFLKSVTAFDHYEIRSDAGFYIWNHASLTEGMFINSFCLPYELKASEQRELLQGVGTLSEIPACEKIIYGYIPLMQTANCITNTVSGCRNGKGPELDFLTDRYKKRFPVLRNCRHCINTIYNCLPLSLHKEMDKWQDSVAFRLDFTIENGSETERILQYFMDGARGELPFAEYTSGHEKRGVE